MAIGTDSEVIWSCEHDPVYTTGRRGVDNRLTATAEVPFVRTDRGGETTFHGPGQLMFYPITDLRHRKLGARNYVFLLEQSCMDLLQSFDIQTSRKHSLPGLWIHDAKIAAIGLRIVKGIAYHGMSLNVDVSPHWFEAIHACGTSFPSVNMSSHLKNVPDYSRLAGIWESHFLGLLEKAAFPFTA
ncbi:MAG: lipoyl(octanoyl) transferase LipB [Mariprofundaceae bacterium]